jgi:hypothetical protein
MKTELKVENSVSTRNSELMLDIFKPNQELILTFQARRDFTYETVAVYAFDLGMKQEVKRIFLLRLRC